MKKLMIYCLFFSQPIFATEFDRNSFEQAITEIQKRSIHKISKHQIYQAAIKGVLRHLEERNQAQSPQVGFKEDANILLPTQKLKQMNKEINGEITGIGVSVQYDRSLGQVYPILLEVIKEGGADRAGLLEGDQILKIDGKPVNKLGSFKDIVYSLRGKEGTRVRLSILRDGEAFDKKVVRRKVKWDAVKLSEIDPNTSLIRVHFFNKKTVEAVEDSLLKIRKRGHKNLIVDLRRHSGGLFDEGVKAIKLFAKKNQPVLVVESSKGQKQTLFAKKKGVGQGFKVVVLVSKDTKSMGEAFASSLRDLTGATLVGEKSFGKATMESVVSLGKDYSMKMTVGRMSTPNGQTWGVSGLIPDIELPPVKNNAVVDSQLQLAKTLLSL